MVTQQRVVGLLTELADTLVDDFDVIDFLHLLAERVIEVLDATAAGVMLADQDNTLQVLAASSEESKLVELFELQNDEGPCMDCFATGTAIANVPLAEAAHRWPGLYPALLANDFQTVYAFPLRLRGEVIGAMNVFSTGGPDASDDEVAIAQALADVATIGLLQHRALHARQVLAEQLQGALNSRVLIEQAKGMICERHGIGMDVAFIAMRAYARQNRKALSDVADAIISGGLDSTVVVNA